MATKGLLMVVTFMPAIQPANEWKAREGGREVRCKKDEWERKGRRGDGGVRDEVSQANCSHLQKTTRLFSMESKKPIVILRPKAWAR